MKSRPGGRRIVPRRSRPPSRPSSYSRPSRSEAAGSAEEPEKAERRRQRASSRRWPTRTRSSPGPQPKHSPGSGRRASPRSPGRSETPGRASGRGPPSRSASWGGQAHAGRAGARPARCRTRRRTSAGARRTRSAPSAPAASAAVPALREALHDADEDVRRGAALALERIDPAGWVRAPSWESTVATIERLTPLLMGELHVPGVSIALVRDRKVAWTKSWGVADVRTGTPVTGETLFEAASMTKPVFAASVLKLVEQGKIDLDRPLSEYVAPPSVPVPGGAPPDHAADGPVAHERPPELAKGGRGEGRAAAGPLRAGLAVRVFRRGDLPAAAGGREGDGGADRGVRPAHALRSPRDGRAPRTSGRRSSTPGSRAGTRRTGRSSRGRATPTRTPPTRSSRRPRTTRGSSSRSSTRRAPRRTGSLAPPSRRCSATRSAST